MKHKNIYTITANNIETEKSVKKYLKQSEGFSSRFVTKISKADGLFVNNKRVFACYPVKNGDEIRLILPEEETFIEPVEIPVEILHEDEDLIIVNKAPYMVVHPTPSHPNDTLANALAWRFARSKNECKCHFVNRLDMNTSGIVVVAKNRHAHHFIQTQGQQGRIKKSYLALCHGRLAKQTGLIDAPIGREEEDSIYRTVRPDGKPSRTLYEVVSQKGEFSLVRLTLLTGRTHQIRVHMKHMGAPLIADDLYYPHHTDIIPRQALHAFETGFIHPKTKRSVLFMAPLPEDMIRALKTTELYESFKESPYGNISKQ